LGFVCGAETIVVRLGVDEESGRESVDFLLWKENWDFVAEEPFFMAVSDGTRRPRGRFSESKIAIFSGERRSWSDWAQSMYRSGATWVDIVAITDYLRHRFFSDDLGTMGHAGFRGGMLCCSSGCWLKGGRETMDGKRLKEGN
jgi:hypothetical protein